jgi:hypothetical protein
MKRINYWDYALTEWEYRKHELTHFIFCLCIPATCFLLSPIFLLYILICKCFTIKVTDDYEIFQGEKS